MKYHFIAGGMKICIVDKIRKKEKQAAKKMRESDSQVEDRETKKEREKIKIEIYSVGKKR